MLKILYEPSTACNTDCEHHCTRDTLILQFNHKYYKISMEINFKTKGASTSERGSSLWAATDNVEVVWLKSVWSTDSKPKPNYGI